MFFISLPLPLVSSFCVARPLPLAVRPPSDATPSFLHGRTPHIFRLMLSLRLMVLASRFVAIACVAFAACLQSGRVEINLPGEETRTQRTGGGREARTRGRRGEGAFRLFSRCAARPAMGGGDVFTIAAFAGDSVPFLVHHAVRFSLIVSVYGPRFTGHSSH